MEARVIVLTLYVWTVSRRTCHACHRFGHGEDISGPFRLFRDG